MGEGPVVLIGPAAVGKSTVGVEVARVLGRPFVDLDEIADEYYDEAGQSLADLVDRIGSHGLVDAHGWWQPARVHAVRRCVDEHIDAVIALGAGHSHYEDVSHFEAARKALASATVVLLLPHVDDDASEAFLAERCRAERGEDWGGGGFLAAWVRSEQNRALATIEVLVADRTPVDIAAEIAEQMRLRSTG